MSCGGNKENTDASDDVVLVKQNITETNDGLQKMQIQKAEAHFKMDGKEYQSIVTRIPDETLTEVIGENDEKFVDNKITLNITCAGKSFYNKTFTKSDFESIIEPAFLRKSILEGLVYNKVSSKGILYAASVCYPQTDLYIPISILITPQGKMSMKKDEMLEEIYESEGL